MTVRRGVILDRDGTLIDVVREEETGVVVTAFHPRHLRLLPGVVEGLKALAGAGFTLAIATNQPGAAKGQFSTAAIEQTNAALVELLADQAVHIEAVEVCLHHPDGGPGGDAGLVRACDCRKPKPGMLTALTRRLGLHPGSSWMLGDSAADAEAGSRAGLNTALLLPQGRCELCPLRDASGAAIAVRPAPAVSSSNWKELTQAIIAFDAAR